MIATRSPITRIMIVVTVAQLLSLPAPPLLAQQAPACVAVFEGIQPNEIALSPCEKYLAAAGWQPGADGFSLLVVWDLNSKKEVFRHQTLQKRGFKTVI